MMLHQALPESFPGATTLQNTRSRKTQILRKVFLTWTKNLLPREDYPLI